MEMNNEKIAVDNPLYSLVSLDEFKSVLGIDDREDKLCRFCLVTSTLTIESYCMRKFLRKQYFERIPFFGDLLFPLQEYPVSEILAAYIQVKNEEIVEPEFYQIIPDCGTDKDIPFSIELSPALMRVRGLTAVKVIYSAGYSYGSVPMDLEAACLELAAWNWGRYRCKRIGMTGSIRKDGDRLEMAMPENVQSLLESYRRKTI